MTFFRWQWLIRHGVHPPRQHQPLPLGLQRSLSLPAHRQVRRSRHAIGLATLLWVVQHHSYQPLPGLSLLEQAVGGLGIYHCPADRAGGHGSGDGARFGVKALRPGVVPIAHNPE